jgi:hypothetical protein
MYAHPIAVKISITSIRVRPGTPSALSLSSHNLALFLSNRTNVPGAQTNIVCPVISNNCIVTSTLRTGLDDNSRFVGSINVTSVNMYQEYAVIHTTETRIAYIRILIGLGYVTFVISSYRQTVQECLCRVRPLDLADPNFRVYALSDSIESLAQMMSDSGVTAPAYLTPIPVVAPTSPTPSCSNTSANRRYAGATARGGTSPASSAAHPPRRHS